VATDTASNTSKISGVETRSIDYVPLDERHGKLWHLGPLWFMSNAQIATLAVGLIAIGAGSNLVWALIAIIAGVLLGTLFMAFHSAQGPQLGLPQMIQSRPQFGYVGALLVWLFAYIQYAGFNVFNTILGGQAMSATVHGSPKLWYVAITVVGVAVALFGYDMIHRFERYLTYVTVAVLIVFTIGALATLHFPSGAMSLGGFKATPFLAEFGAVAGYQISWAIYVSDYSRYLPPDVTVRRTFQWTYWGSGLGAIWLMCLGAIVQSAAHNTTDGKPFNTVVALQRAADGAFHPLGDILLIVAAIGLVSVLSLNLYGGALTLISGLDSLKTVKPTLAVRAMTIGVTAALSLIGALVASDNFLANFTNFLLLVLYFFIPWTAVNLVDYYVVRRGHYVIAEIFKPHGMYGRWGWRGITAYLVGFAAMIPFFSTNSLYIGFVSKKLNDADISLFVGLPISAILYYVLARSIDVDAERAVEREQAAGIETMAGSHGETDLGLV
jgi:nucleobase:cation symporter-1, NCS1 family